MTRKQRGLVAAFKHLGYEPHEGAECVRMVHPTREGVEHHVYGDGTTATYVNGRLTVARDDPRVNRCPASD